MTSLAAGTIVSKRYVSLARVLALSFREHHPDIPFFVLLADEIDGFFEPTTEPFQLVPIADLSIGPPERFCFRHAQQPLSYASTPFFLRHLLDEGVARAIFLKQESLVVGDLSPVFQELERHSIALTPHLLRPLGGTDGAARELNILQSGVFNVGLIGVSDTPTSRRFLDWWQDRVYDHCRLAVGEGMHYEQRWIDLVPAFFEDVHVLRDPGGNVGHWNLPERNVQVGDDGITVDGEAARLFRFSGFDPDDPARATRHTTRLTMETIGPAAVVFGRYARLLEEAGYPETRRWPYAFGFFDNGVPIPDVARQIYRELGEAVEVFGDPFRSKDRKSYFHWLNRPADSADCGPSVSRLWEAIYRQRPDVRRAFPDVRGADRQAFLDWTARSGAPEHGIPEPFLGHTRAGSSRGAP